METESGKYSAQVGIRLKVVEMLMTKYISIGDDQTENIKKQANTLSEFIIGKIQN